MKTGTWMTAVWVYPALQVQDSPEQKNKRNSTTPFRTIRVLMIKTVGLPIVRLNICTFPCRSDQTVSGISTIKSSTNIKYSFQVIRQGHSIPLPLSFTICPVLTHTDTCSHIFTKYILFCLTKNPNQLQPCAAQPTVKSHWSKILLHTCKTSDFAFSMENVLNTKK